MHAFVVLCLVAAASAAPQLVPYAHQEIAAEEYLHQEIAAEPYLHQEIEAEPYVHIEPALTPEALGLIATAPVAVAGYAAAPYAPANAFGPVAGTAFAAGLCRNNLGASVPCAL
jgi:hypothetical protein